MPTRLTASSGKRSAIHKSKARQTMRYLQPRGNSISTVLVDRGRDTKNFDTTGSGIKIRINATGIRYVSAYRTFY